MEISHKLNPTILIVTPSFNAQRFIEDTIASVIGQRGKFNLVYHIQDACSTDGTIEIVKKWENRISNGYGTRDIGFTKFSWVSEQDSGMYDAINRGFNHARKINDLSNESFIIMTWINSDDIIVANAFSTVTSFMLEFPYVEWVVGKSSLINEHGAIIDSHEIPKGYSQADLALGLHDGRKKCFIQQEGVFWRETIWLKTHGLDPSFRLAGDWDLWRRFALESAPVKLPCVLALHRRHTDQLSNNMVKYYLEVDNAADHSVKLEGAGDSALRAEYCLIKSAWTVIKVPAAKWLKMDSNKLYLIDFSQSGLPDWISNISGLSGVETWGRWSDQALAPSVRIVALNSLPWDFILNLKFRSIFSNKPINVSIQIGLQKFQLQLQSEKLEFSMNVKNETKANVIDFSPSDYICPKQAGWSSDERILSIGFCELKILPIESCVNFPKVWPSESIEHRSYRTAWTWLHKFRLLMVFLCRDKLTGKVEVDETLVEGKKSGKKR